MANTNYNPSDIIKQAQASLPRVSGKATEVVLRRNTDHPGQPFKAGESQVKGQGAVIGQKALDAFRNANSVQETPKVVPTEGSFGGLSSSKVTALPSHLKSNQGRGNLRFFSDNLSEVRNQLFKN